jgi:C4-type Zn-finger protein
LNFPLFMDDDDEKEKAKESTTFIYEGATEIEISATAVLRDFLAHPRVLEKCKQLDVLAPSSTTERPVLRKFLLSNVTETPWDSSAETKILHPSFQCVSKDLLDIVQTIERECITTTKTPTTTTTASSLLRRIYKREFARYSATSIAEDLTALRRIHTLLDGTENAAEERHVDKNRKQRRQKRVVIALKLRLSEKILLRACLNDAAFAEEEMD